MGDSGSFTELVVDLVGFGKRIEGSTLRANTHEQVASPALAIAVARTLDFGEESAKFDIEGSKAYCLCCRAASFCLTSLASERINATAKLKSVCEHLQQLARRNRENTYNECGAAVTGARAGGPHLAKRLTFG